MEWTELEELQAHQSQVKAVDSETFIGLGF